MADVGAHLTLTDGKSLIPERGRPGLPQEWELWHRTMTKGGVRVFDAPEADPKLTGPAGLVPVIRLDAWAGLRVLLPEHLTISSPNSRVKAAGVVAGMLAGAHCIDDLDVLRLGGRAKVFTAARVPWTWTTIREVHCYQKQGAAYGYYKVKGLNAQIRTTATTT